MPERVEALRVVLAEWRNRLEQPWLVAAWPGMGSIGQLAAAHLAQQPGARLIAELPAAEYYEAQPIQVERGLILERRLPSNRLLGFEHPTDGRDLVLFVGSAQPEYNAHRFCEELVVVARALGAARVCTFAAMPTLMHPETRPRVFVAASETQLLDEARFFGAQPLADGSIGGLNGLLIAAAAAQGIPGVCLLGEMPCSGDAVANPRAAAAVLRTLMHMAHREVDLTALDEQAAKAERGLAGHGKRVRKATEPQPSAIGGHGPFTEQQPAATSREREAKARIEQLFAETRRDRRKAAALKAELDRQGVFRDYEDRFLDLFQRAP